jgi:hypothetical protein
MADNQRDPTAGAPRRNDTTDDDLNREDITPDEGNAERAYHENHGQQEPTDPDSAFSEVDRDDTIDD